jgi:phosphotransferase family enzyme
MNESEAEHGPMADGDPAASPVAGVAIWGSEAWRAEALAWLDTQLVSRGIRRTGTVEQPHLRPWATALRVPTSAGLVWLKAAGPGTAFEVRLYGLLSRLAPEHVLTPLAIDEARAWVVLPDGGATLGAVAPPEALPEALASALAHYARLQRALSPHVDALVALGVSDMRAARLPERFELALGICERYVARTGSAEDRALLDRVVAERPAFVARCAELESSAVPPSLDHNDLHPWNIFAAPEGAPARAYDWGDSVVAHPFASLLVALGFLRHAFHAGLDDPRITRVRDAYLAAFADRGSHAELVHTARLACHVGKVARALSWARAIAAEGDSAGPHARAPLHWLGALLDPAYVIEGG